VTSNFLISSIAVVSDELERQASLLFSGSTEQETFLDAVETLDDVMDLLHELGGVST
jgi:hypothetical protein